MNNFFNTIPTAEGNIYFLAWLLHSSELGETVCVDLAKIFLSKCYNFQSNIPAPKNIEKFRILEVDRFTIYCLVNDEDLLVIKTYMSDNLYKMISSKHLDTSFLHEREANEVYEAKNYLYLFLETQYIGNILQIREETIYDIFPMENYVDFLLSFAELCDSQIKNELAIYEKHILDSYWDFQNIKYKDWSINQYKGFFRALQKKLNQGEGKQDSEFGDLWYFDFFELKKGKTSIYFRLKHNKEYLEIRAGFDSQKDKKSQRKVLIQKIKNELESHNINFKTEKNPGRSWYYTTLGNVEDPIIATDSNGLLNIDNTIQQLKKYQSILDALVV